MYVPICVHEGGGIEESYVPNDSLPGERDGDWRGGAIVVDSVKGQPVAVLSGKRHRTKSPLTFRARHGDARLAQFQRTCRRQIVNFAKTLL